MLYFFAAVGAAFVFWKVFTAFLGAKAPVSFTADAYLRDQLKKHGISPASIHPKVMETAAYVAILQATNPDTNAVDRTFMAQRIETAALVIFRARSGRFEDIRDEWLWKVLCGYLPPGASPFLDHTA